MSSFTSKRTLEVSLNLPRVSRDELILEKRLWNSSSPNRSDSLSQIYNRGYLGKHLWNFPSHRSRLVLETIPKNFQVSATDGGFVLSIKFILYVIRSVESLNIFCKFQGYQWRHQAYLFFDSQLRWHKFLFLFVWKTFSSQVPEYGKFAWDLS